MGTKHFASLALLTAVMLSCLACDELPDESPSEASATAVAIGVPAEAASDGWKLTVTEVRRVPSIDVNGQTKQALGVYLAVGVSMENTSTKRQALGGNRFKLVDDEGRNYTWYEAGTNAHGKQELGSRINPGLTAPAVIIFDVPANATGLVLRGIGGVGIALGDAAGTSQ
ncbi:MAG: DUF4352 domain-containing protein [Dehalococcoidia bacterium]